MPVRTRRKVLSDQTVELLCAVATGLANSGFIGAPEFGTLSQVCRAMNQFIMLEDCIWAVVCQKKYPSFAGFFTEDFKEWRVCRPSFSLHEAYRAH